MEMQMKDNNLGKLGGACSILVGVSYLLLGTLVIFQLPELRQAVMAGNMGRYLELTAQRPGDIVSEGIVYIVDLHPFATLPTFIPPIATLLGWIGLTQ